MEGIGFSVVAEALRGAGAAAVAAVRAEAVSDADREQFGRWLESGMNAGMEYMHNWPGLRFDPRELHPGTAFVICCAFPYAQNLAEAPQIASYALGADYHKVIPKRIKKALRGLENDFYGSVRICVDSAPVRERYWAVRSGLATRCDSGLVAVPGLGTQFFLAEILTTWKLTGPEPFLNLPSAAASVCDACGACRRACPAGAIGEGGTVDANRCVSYLTIEHKGDWTDAQREAMSLPTAKGRLFGCEICQRVCHLNRNVPTTAIPEFAPRPELLAMTAVKATTLTTEDFDRLTQSSPLRRTGLDALRRNAGV